MMLGGLMSSRPDRGLLDVRVETAVRAGRWAVIQVLHEQVLL
jgi:hypothetical protein